MRYRWLTTGIQKRNNSQWHCNLLFVKAIQTKPSHFVSSEGLSQVVFWDVKKFVENVLSLLKSTVKLWKGKGE